MGLRFVGGSITRVPTPDGRCLWIADSVTPVDGPEIRNVAFLPDLTTPYGTCPTRAAVLGGVLRSAVFLEGSGGPGYLVEITGGWLEAGETVVSYRLFHFDPMGGFGVTEDGTGLGRWDAATQSIHVPGPEGIRWPPSIDLGDAVLPARSDRSYTYLWGCPPPIHDLVEDCVLARRDGGGVTEYFTPTGWSSASSPLVRTFTAGPWQSSVTVGTRGFTHVYAVGFGTDLEQHTATFPYGPWTDAPRIAHCDLPSGDSHAYCAGPVVHEELDDPTRSDDLAVTYGLGTTDMPGERIATRPDDYWTRLVWVRAP